MGIKNPIRVIMDNIAGKENPTKRVISLAQGDPTAYPHLRPSEAAISAVTSALAAGTSNGYQPSQGNVACRQALAEAFNASSRAPLTPNDVFMTLGCSEALSHCVAALARGGSNMLLPRPGFCLYEVLCDYHGVEARYYDLLPEKNWEVDMDNLSALVDANTCAILICNPSNPCGAVYSRSHLEALLSHVESLKVPVIADEVYAGMSFEKGGFVPCADVNPSVPILSVCALSKRWLAPGWRVGWLTVHDNEEHVLRKAEVPDTILKLCQISLGPSAPIQAAIPAILSQTPQSWYDDVLSSLKESADVCIKRCNAIPGLEVASAPQGSMYFMCRIDVARLKGIESDVDFAGQLLQEESVAVLPGACFHAPNFFRVVFAAPANTIELAFDRIEVFCKRRYL